MVQQSMKPTFGIVTIVCFIITLFEVWASKSFVPSISNVKYTPFLSNLNIKSRVICAVLCLNNPQCLNFGFHAAQGKCRLYKSIQGAWQSPISEEEEFGWEILTIQIAGEDVAKFKTATSSSVYNSVVPSLINNNNQNDYFQGGSGDFYPWVLIDLGQVYNVEVIFVYKLGLYPELIHNLNYEFHMKNPNTNSNSTPFCCASTPGFYQEGRNMVRCNRNTRGRFLKIYSFEKMEFLRINEVEVLGELTDGEVTSPSLCRQPIDYGQNIARNKETSSQIFPDMLSWLVVDGKLNSEGLGFFTSGLFLSPWWSVDLKDQFNITSVTIYPRTLMLEIESNLFRDVTIHVYPDRFDPSSVCVFIPGAIGRTVRTFTCTNKTIGRHVRISQPLPKFELVEIEVTGEKL